MPETLNPVRRRRKQDRPQELLDAALDLFVEKGFAATRAEEVAARAGVSKGTLYLYYPSKEDLLKAVISQRLSAEIAEGAERAAAHPGSSADVLRDVLTAWWTRVVESPVSGIFKLVITEVRNFPEIADFYRSQVIEPGQQLIGRFVRRGIQTGEFRDVDPDAVVFSLVLPMIMLCLHKHSIGACSGMEPIMDAPKFIRQHIGLVLDGLLSPQAPARRKAAAS
jgi:AcrR family transcriptional regulator